MKFIGITESTEFDFEEKTKIFTYASGVLLWEIPKYFHSLNLEYKIYCRHYGTGVETMICCAMC